jgi:hypothetical protein
MMDQLYRQLIDTERRTIMCPRCEEEQPMRDFATLGMSPLYAEVLTPIFRCKLCNHLFAPKATAMPVLATSGTTIHTNGTGH